MENRSDHQRLRKFLHQHGVRVRQVYMQRYQSPQIDYANFNSNYQHYFVQQEEIPAIEGTFPIDVFEDLIETQETVENLKRAFGPDVLTDLNKAYRVMSQNRQEEYARQHNPAVKKAWDNYQLLLRIAGE